MVWSGARSERLSDSVEIVFSVGPTFPSTHSIGLVKEIPSSSQLGRPRPKYGLSKNPKKLKIWTCRCDPETIRYGIDRVSDGYNSGWRWRECVKALAWKIKIIVKILCHFVMVRLGHRLDHQPKANLLHRATLDLPRYGANTAEPGHGFRSLWAVKLPQKRRYAHYKGRVTLSASDPFLA
jgi:hypothetical protein